MPPKALRSPSLDGASIPRREARCCPLSSLIPAVEWSDDLLQDANRVVQSIPAKVCRARQQVPFPIADDDPSEALRSSEIVQIVKDNFEILESRDYGGNLLSVIFPLVKWDRLDSETKEQVLADLIQEERAVLEKGVPSYYSVIVARNGT